LAITTLKEKHLKRDEVIVGIVLFLLGGATVLLSLKMPIGTFQMAGTGMFPLILGILLMFLSCLLLFKLFYQGKKTTVRRDPVSKVRGSPIHLILFFGTMVLATAFFNQLGYPLSSFLLMVALLRILGMKRWRVTLPLSFITAVVCYFIFVQFLKIPLPKGWIGL
jgi:putative tricarboxylic transport membrane protein